MEEIDIKDFLNYLKEKILYIIASVLLFIIIVLIYSIFIKVPKYSTYTTIALVKANDNTKILFANLMLSIVELKNAINEDVKIKYVEKEELLIILKALNQAVHLEELIIINALLIPLEHTIGKNKKYKTMYEKLKLLIADIYY